MARPIRPHRDDEAFRELVESVGQRGVLRPLLVRPVSDGFEVVCGHRRHAAATELELREISVLIRSIPEDRAFLVGLRENIDRSEINSIEEAEAYRAVLAHGPVKQQADLARELSVSRARVSRSLALLELPLSVVELFYPLPPGCGRPLTERHARVLRSLNSSEEQVELARRVVGEGMSVEQLQALVDQAASPVTTKLSPSVNLVVTPLES